MLNQNDYPMKAFLFAVLIMSATFATTAQSLEYTKNNKRFVPATKSDSEPIIFFPIISQSMWYPPKKVQGLHVISVNRPNSVMDDVYFIDQSGNTQYHTIKPTSPINLYMQRIERRHFDSFNPHGSRNFEEAIGNGVSSILSGLIFMQR